MKSNLRPFFDLTITIHSALQILWSIGSACGYTSAELKDLEHRLITKAHELVAHIQDEERACDPYRLVFVALNDLRSENDRWHTWLIHRRLRANQMRYAEWWSRLDPNVGVARLILVSET